MTRRGINMRVAGAHDTLKQRSRVHVIRGQKSIVLANLEMILNLSTSLTVYHKDLIM